MALIHCPECAREISDSATACPGCGAPRNLSKVELEPQLQTTATSTEVVGGTQAKVGRRGWAYKGPFGFLRRHWNGEYSLARSYWLNTFLISLFAPGIGLVLFPFVSDRPARFASAAALFVTALGYAAWFWAARGTWISATKQEATGRKWGGVAKGMLVLGVLRLAGQVAKDSGGIGEHWATLLGKQAGPQYAIHVSGDGTSVNITGGMNDGAADALTQALNFAPGVRTVTFDSGGGWVREGGLVAAVISQRNLETHVDGECSSACTLAFLAGKVRTVGPRARLGFHQVRSVGRSADDRAVDVDKTQSIYQSAGLPSDFIHKVTATPPDKVWYPTLAELRVANVITGTTEWDAARAELTRRFRATLETNLKTIRLPENTFDALLDCEVGEDIKWLNTTDCSYLYDKAAKSLEKHLEEQDACLIRAGNAARLAEIDLACTKMHLPNDWSIYSDMFAKSFAARFDPRHPNSPMAQGVGACAAAQYTAELNRTVCTPMNLEASTSEAMFAGDCIDKLHPRRISAILRECRAAPGRDD